MEDPGWTYRLEKRYPAVSAMSVRWRTPKDRENTRIVRAPAS